MLEKKVTIQNPTGLNVRPAGVLCREAMNFRCSVNFRAGHNVVANAKSVLSVLGAQVRSGDEITLVCDGEDEAEAIERIARVIEDGLEE